MAVNVEGKEVIMAPLTLTRS